MCLLAKKHQGWNKLSLRPFPTVVLHLEHWQGPSMLSPVQSHQGWNELSLRPFPTVVLHLKRWQAYTTRLLARRYQGWNWLFRRLFETTACFPLVFLVDCSNALQ